GRGRVPPRRGLVRVVAGLGELEEVVVLLPVEDGVGAVPVEVVGPPNDLLPARRAERVTGPAAAGAGVVVGVLLVGAAVLPPARARRPAVAVAALEIPVAAVRGRCDRVCDLVGRRRLGLGGGEGRDRRRPGWRVRRDRPGRGGVGCDAGTGGS